MITSKTINSTFSKLLAAAALLSLSMTAQAITWSNTNIQLLNGSGFELGADKRTILTIENAFGFKYGDGFFFMDVTEPFDDGTAHYAEFAPRFSIAKISGTEKSYGIVKDIMIAPVIEMGDEVRGYLLGVGLPLAIPGFAFANVNVFLRQSERDFAKEQTDTGAQITLTWKRPFTLGASNWSFEGFLDYAFGEDGGTNPKEDNLVAAPRLLLKVSESLEFGIEQQIWQNKFGVDGVNESVTQVMLKYSF